MQEDILLIREQEPRGENHYVWNSLAVKKATPAAKTTPSPCSSTDQELQSQDELNKEERWALLLTVFPQTNPNPNTCCTTHIAWANMRLEMGRLWLARWIGVRQRQMNSSELGNAKTQHTAIARLCSISENGVLLLKGETFGWRYFVEVADHVCYVITHSFISLSLSEGTYLADYFLAWSVRFPGRRKRWAGERDAGASRRARGWFYALSATPDEGRGSPKRNLRIHSHCKTTPKPSNCKKKNQ